MPNTTLYQSPAPKRSKLEVSLDEQSVKVSQLDQNEDLSFLDDINIDEIADCLNNCDNTSTKSHEHTVISKSVTQTINYAYPETTKSHKDDRNLSYELERKLCCYFEEPYNVSSIIHYGKYSTIMKCKDFARNIYAVKILKNKQDKYHGKAKQKMLFQIQSNIPKENLFSIYFKAGFSLKKRWCFIMEFYPKTLNQAMQEMYKPFHITKVQDLARQLVAAVTVLKYNDIIHSDIKPSHILLDYSNERLRLCGFDDAYYNGAIKISPNKGTLNYRPPEIILGYSSGCTIDVWSTAVVLVEMAIGRTLFPGFTNSDILYKQMCMLGNIPNGMLAKSQYKKQYFAGNMFKRKIGFNVVDVEHNFYETQKLNNYIFDAQCQYWTNQNTKKQKLTKAKIQSFVDLVTQMIVIAPEDRVPIDIVYSDPFIYEMFD